MTKLFGLWRLAVFPFTGLMALEADTLTPNIVLMMADDMGMGDTSAYQEYTGNSDAAQLLTPQLDRFARLGIRFTDVHTPASRCTPTRYSLLTGRYSWRSRLKWWVLFGVQGDPLIESDRPTIASLLRDHGYRTALIGKWHLGLRYRRTDGSPAAGWQDADLSQPLYASPLDHGFDFARYTSRSHGTSGPDAGQTRSRKRNLPDQTIGPGHLHGRQAVSATGKGKLLQDSGPHAYVLSKLGSRHSDHALEFLQEHIARSETRTRPFFLYYPANSNHGPYTPDQAIAGRKVAGAARTVDGRPMTQRYDYIYENDVALGRILDWLSTTPDPRNPKRKLIRNTLVIFTSDNGAEKNDDVATGPFRSNKGSCYEGGHRVPFLASWPRGRVGNGNPATEGETSAAVFGLQDLYATFAEILEVELPNNASSEKGGEDSLSVLAALQGKSFRRQIPLFFSDHKEARDDPAALAMRWDSPVFDGQAVPGQWKIFFDAGLVRSGIARPYELYELSSDQKESVNLIDDPRHRFLIDQLTETATRHRLAGGHRLVSSSTGPRIVFDWTDARRPERNIADKSAAGHSLTAQEITVKITGLRGSDVLNDDAFAIGDLGLGLHSGSNRSVERGRGLSIVFDRDVLLESISLAVGETGSCGGTYRLGDSTPQAVYCLDADNDSRNQEGIISDLGILRAGQSLRLDSSPQLGVEAPGKWWLQGLVIRSLNR